MLLRSTLPIGPVGFSMTGSSANVSLPIFELQTGPTDFLILLSTEATVITNNSGPVSVGIGIGVPAVKGNGILSAGFSADDGSRTDLLPGCLFFTQWTKPPTIPSVSLRRMVINPAAGGGTARGPRNLFYFDFPNGLKVQPSSSLVLYAANATVGTYFLSDISFNVDN